MSAHKFTIPLRDLTLIAANVTLVTTGLWFAMSFGPAQTTVLHWLAMGATLTVCVLLHVTGLYYQRRQTAQVQLFLDRLVTGAKDNLPNLPTDTDWRAALEHARYAIESLFARVNEAEHQRAALEVRYRRCLGEKERMNQVLAAVSEPLLVVDQYDQILLSNRAADKLLEIGTLPEERVLGGIRRCEKLLSLIHDTQRRKLPSSRTDEVEIEDTSGSRRSYQASVATLANSDSDKSSEPVGTVTVLRDISALKEIRHHNAEFVSNASHEMKAPLAGIRAYVELLADGDAEDEETREEFLRIINSQTDRLQRLVENLLNLARIEAGVVKVAKQARGLNEILAEAFHVVQPSAQSKSITLVDQTSELYLGIHADRDLLLQCVINLLSNAIKYTPEGGRVTLRSRSLDDEVQFEVEDTGVGLSTEDCEKVFEKFYRVEKDKGMAAGTGLGLPLAKYIVEDVHGGRLSVRSQLGVGSTFLVTIPAAGR